MSDTVHVGKRIPPFASEEEARKFWDTHSSADYWDQMEDVTDNPPPNLRQGPGRDWSRPPQRPDEGFLDVVVTLRGDEIAAARAISARRQVPLFALLHEWVAERLEGERDETPGE